MPPTLGAMFGPQTGEQFANWPGVNSTLDRVRRFVGAGPAQAAGPAYPAQIPPETMAGPIFGPPDPTFGAGISAPPPTGRTGMLPPSSPGGRSAGFINVPEGARFDPNILRSPPSGEAINGLVTSPAGNTYSALPRGSLIDLEGQARTRSLLDSIYPDLAPQNEAAVAERRLKTQMATPLRPGEEPPLLPQAAMAQSQKTRAFQALQSALADWEQRKQAALAEFQQKAAGLGRDQAAAEALRLDDHFDLERQTITLRFAPELVPGFRGGLGDLE